MSGSVKLYGAGVLTGALLMGYLVFAHGDALGRYTMGAGMRLQRAAMATTIHDVAEPESVAWTTERQR